VRHICFVRIAFVTESFLPVVNGVTNSVLRLLEHLDKTPHDALVIAPGKGPDSYLRFPVKRVPSIGVPRYRSFRLGLPCSRVGAALEEFDPEIVYVSAPLGLGAYALRVSRKLGVPTVACYQTDVAGFLDNYGLGVAADAVWKWTARVHNKAGRTLAPSSAAVTDLLANGVGNVQLWRRGVDGQLFAPERRNDALRESWCLDGRIAVGYVGRLAHEKRVDDLKVLAADDRIRLIIVGEGPLRGKLQKELPNAVFAGFRSGGDLASHFASLDVFVHTGQNETFCQTIQEALSSGVPVVAPAQGGPIDLVQPLRNGLLYTPGDADHLRRCTEMIVGSSILREQLASHARKSVEERTWKLICGQWEQHLAEVWSEWGERRRLVA